MKRVGFLSLRQSHCGCEVVDNLGAMGYHTAEGCVKEGWSQLVLDRYG